ncbi:MAG: hypothetical protein NT069_01480 [Planctomycetota bacterium]|nr:hypothetical protein [Planctomycetota bacterium]
MVCHVQSRAAARLARFEKHANFRVFVRVPVESMVAQPTGLFV